MVKSQELVSAQPSLLKALSTHLHSQTGVEVGDTELLRRVRVSLETTLGVKEGG